MSEKMIEKKSWQDFRDSGLFLFINQILHAFGWCIFVEIEEGKIINCFPARTKFRGFGQKDQDEAYKKIDNFLKNGYE